MSLINSERILLAAIKTGDNQVSVSLHPESRHSEIIHHLARCGFETPIKGEQGFLTSTGRFVNRVEAKEIAIKSGVVNETEFNQLYSEDLW